MTRHINVARLIILSSLFLNYAKSTEEKCHLDCQAPEYLRLVGPTRPWNSKDTLGNTLSLTKPHPYSHTPSEVTMIVYDETFKITLPNFSMNENVFREKEAQVVVKTVEEFMRKRIESVSIKLCEDSALLKDWTTFNTVVNEENIPQVGLNLTIEVAVEHNDPNFTSVDAFFYAVLFPLLRENKIEEEMQVLYSRYVQKEAISSLYNSTLILKQLRTSDSQFKTYSSLKTNIPNPYSKFCQIGCTYFFSDRSIPIQLKTCTGKCDHYFRYNISVKYNDLAEMARLECRDGCQIALKRCKPGYYCEQIELQEQDIDEKKYRGGNMINCPPGTYRDVSYDNVEECVPCPMGRFREGEKGRSLESCSKCPIGTYANRYGNTSIKNCLRCPAGQFASEEGSGQCVCITSEACKENQFLSPANAEKHDTVPFIGRW